MRFRLLRNNRRFYQLFSEAGRNALACAERYATMLADYRDPAAAVDEIRALEHRGDELTREIARRLATTFVTPLDHGDIHKLATTIDDVSDHIEAAADNCFLHHIETPTEAVSRQADTLVKGCTAMADAIDRLEEQHGIWEAVAEVHRFEKEGDQIFRRAIAGLFSGAYPAMEILRWREIYENAEAAIDACEQVASRLEEISLKYH